jgi:site-specific DNA recombinase
MHDRAAIYLRISEDRYDDRLAITRQRADCLRIVRERGWSVAGEYIDNDLSASNRRKVRPEYDRLTEDFNAGSFDALVCYDLDRLTRQPRQLEDWIDAAEERGLVLVTANGEADLSTDSGRMFARVKVAFARSEIETKSRRQKSQIQQRLASGRPILGGKRRYGFLGDHMTEQPIEAAIVRQMYEDVVAGTSLHRIQSVLNANGVPTAYGYFWDATKIRKILTNPAYKGVLTHRGIEVATDQVAKIIPTELWDTVNAILNDPRRRVTPGPMVRTGLLSGIATCGVCGALMRSTANTQRGKTMKLYSCSAKVMGRVTGTHPTIRRQIADGAIAAELFRPVLAGQVGSGSRGEVGALIRELAEIDAKRERAMTLYIDSGDRQAHKAHTTLGIRGTAVESRISALRANDAASLLLEGFESNVLEWMDGSRGRDWVGADFDEVQQRFVERFEAADIDTRRALAMARFSAIRIYPIGDGTRIETVVRELSEPTL